MPLLCQCNGSAVPWHGCVQLFCCRLPVQGSLLMGQGDAVSYRRLAPGFWPQMFGTKEAFNSEFAK